VKKIRHPYPELHDQLVAAGWEFRMSGTGHLVYSAPAGWQGVRKRVVMPSSPSDNHRGRRNTIADVKRVLKEGRNDS
jgi:hypothetical protein